MNLSILRLFKYIADFWFVKCDSLPRNSRWMGDSPRKLLNIYEHILGLPISQNAHPDIPNWSSVSAEHHPGCNVCLQVGWIPMFARWLTFFCRSNILQLPILQWLGPSTASGSSWWDRPFLPGAIKEGDDSAYSRRDGDVSPCLNNTWMFGELESGMESAQIGVCIGIMYGDAWCKEPTKN